MIAQLRFRSSRTLSSNMLGWSRSYALGFWFCVIGAGGVEGFGIGIHVGGIGLSERGMGTTTNRLTTAAAKIRTTRGGEGACLLGYMHMDMDMDMDCGFACILRGVGCMYVDALASGLEYRGGMITRTCTVQIRGAMEQR